MFIANPTPVPSLSLALREQRLLTRLAVLIGQHLDAVEDGNVARGPNDLYVYSRLALLEYKKLIDANSADR
jgi:hypothetical protein